MAGSLVGWVGRSGGWFLLVEGAVFARLVKAVAFVRVHGDRDGFVWGVCVFFYIAVGCVRAVRAAVREGLWLVAVLPFCRRRVCSR